MTRNKDDYICAVGNKCTSATPLLTHPMQLILVERVDEGNRRSDKPVWLVWVGETMPPLSDLWQLYCRRFGVDHWFRFAKQRLHWTLPHLSSAKQAERWRI